MSDSSEIPVKVVDRRWWARSDAAADDAAAAEPSLKPSYVEELETRLAEKDRELQDVIARYRQASHEFDDARARFRREVARDVERGTRAVLADLLDVVDNLDLAISAGRDTHNADALREGIEIVRRQFLAKLASLGVARIESSGQTFDPAVHEAVTTVPTDDEGQDNVIVGVIREGYRIGSDLLRPAQVAVARRQANERDDRPPAAG